MKKSPTIWHRDRSGEDFTGGSVRFEIWISMWIFRGYFACQPPTSELFFANYGDHSMPLLRRPNREGRGCL